ncbi:MAG: bifunctional 2-C-methyl-D-erythritol 4-phosphate cytidylyltransferase/2-C-methyl-D-erythritol 2,4-cyclodiphosphate synthase [Mesorhizobium sp.]
MSPSSETAVVIVAAGRGERAGSPASGPKQYRLIGGEPVIRRTLRAFDSHGGIGRIVVAIHADDRELFEAAAGEFAERVTVVIGGPTRQESTRLALHALVDPEPHCVLIHDAVRPFISHDVIDRVIAASRLGGGLAAMPIADTIKRRTQTGLETVDRSTLHSAQTPQGFAFAPILKAHEDARVSGRTDFTDDTSIAEWAGLKVSIVMGSPENVKLTFPEDLVMAEQRLAANQPMFPDVRTGNGYDVHSFEPGNAVVLCGIAIPHDMKLSGHSDADVGLHALTDALLATCGAGDIGTHFPPSEPQWKGAASHIFVEHAAQIVRERQGRIANADITLICEAPKVGPHREAMTAAIAEMLSITPDRVSIKATTNEKLGFVGRKEGIAAIATVSVVFPGSLPA